MKRSSLITFLAPLVVASSLNAASDYLLEIDGIKGESADSRHPETIEIESFSWGASNTGASGSGGGAGKVSFQDLHFTTKVSKASPQLLLACANGQHIKKAVLFVRKSGSSESQEYLVITLEDVLVSGIAQTGQLSTSPTTGDSRPSEQLSLNFTKVIFRHTADDGTETIGEAVRTPVVE